VKLASLSTPSLEGWRDRLVAQPFSRRHSRKILFVLKAILADAQARGLVAQNVPLPVKIDARKRSEKKLEIGVDIPGKADIQKLLVTLSAPRWRRHRPMLVCAIFTGMRASKLRGLAWSAVDFEKNAIAVRQRAGEWGKIGMTKSVNGQREIPLSPTLFNTLREWRLACPKSEQDLVFPNTVGKVERLANIAHGVWRPLQKAGGLVAGEGGPLFNFHALRHFAASLWIELGF